MCEAVEHPECDAFYSDVIICRGSKPVAECRPAFCPDYLREYNYIASSVVFSKGAIENALFTDYGDVLSAEALNHTCLLHIAGNHGRVAHLPYFLLEDGNSEGPDAKKFSKLARQVLEELGIREGYSVEDGEFSEVVRVDWNPPADAPLVSIIIPTKDQLDLLCQCINSVFQKTSWENFEIIIVNNQSAQKETQDYLEMVSGFPKVKVLDYSKPFNYSAINNFAVSKAEGEFIVLLNNDVEVISPDWLSIMLGQAAREEVGCVGANLFFPDDTHQHAGVIVGYGGVAGHAHKFFERGHRGYMNRLICTQNYSAVTAACLLISKKKFLELGGLDEVNLTVAFNDVDLCLKAAAKGYLNVWVPGAMLYHHESVSRGSDKFGEAKIRFLNEIAFMKSRWITDKFEDRAYNRNLTLKREDFSLKKFF
ncbi:hypothetical protein MNKW57_30560 [Biformimicrobium ophioploci]|uniref:Glycosyltransferase 2-like domain-containing protein n=2 Tax=Biformimicrobium ophioploci TaxID=3036711 RepID=A0ABQ6M317_9GAMM|nr:hypothetical protein MNKW57_30560 [Microbulbifer sp. NKW57]